MKDVAALVTAIAALIAAIAWPAALVVVFLLFRTQLVAAFEKLPTVMGRMQKIKLGLFETDLEKEASGLVDQAVAEPGKISQMQIRSAARIQVAAKSLDKHELWNQLQQLSIEYEETRKLLPSGLERSRAMTEILVRMRTLAPSVAPFLDELKQSDIGGDRLAAVTIMQVTPGRADLDWLAKRFLLDAPFVFFQAALALRNAAQMGDKARKQRIKALAEQALQAVQGYDGVPDKNTVLVLEQIIEEMP